MSYNEATHAYKCPCCEALYWELQLLYAHLYTNHIKIVEMQEKRKEH